jgi:hypothetical protein
MYKETILDTNLTEKVKIASNVWIMDARCTVVCA